MKEMAGQAGAGSEDKCPVDHKTRELWLQQAKQAKAAQEAAAAAGGSTTPSPENAFTTPVAPAPAAAVQQQPPTPPTQSQIPQPAQQTAVPAALPTSQPSSSSWSSWLPFTSSSSGSSAPPSTLAPPQSSLGEHREISSIPRAATTGPSACPSNAEQETGADTATGNWVYPSEKQFYEAMKRKGHDGASAADMKTVVPIHNAVNERAWAEILRWEKPFTGEGCGCAEGPKLQSFMGESKRMTPKARLNTLLGYTAPFDRHDWIVDRCGTRVDYVIDFYAGRNNDKAGAGKLNFYLDVRPKLNTWEGVKMRALGLVGLN
ncbi:cytochrome c/c1 heme-lyase [Neurospora tetraspora]|uniref:Holocytochrome c-type synthase n=1 Tax=Neurospora tetraspora TaxID=94610 RepID=A0AAE0JIB9_9PEZI|nr:cytochrome c/c1 heme-lyase [Neurospora tetraspora]